MRPKGQGRELIHSLSGTLSRWPLATCKPRQLVCLLIEPACWVMITLSIVHSQSLDMAPTLTQTIACKLHMRVQSCVVAVTERGGVSKSQCGATDGFLQPCECPRLVAHLDGRLLYPKTGQGHCLVLRIRSLPNWQWMSDSCCLPFIRQSGQLVGSYVLLKKGKHSSDTTNLGQTPLGFLSLYSARQRSSFCRACCIEMC